MKILKSLNKNIFFIYFLFINLIFIDVSANEPVDIWNLDKLENEKVKTLKENSSEKNSIFNSIEISNSNDVFLTEEKFSPNNSLIGLYDPDENNLPIDMWSNSDGDQIKSVMKKIEDLNLSKDANKILEIALLTNSYVPKKNITNQEFTNYKINFLLKKNKFDLIEEFIKRNNNAYNNKVLIKHYIDNFLLNSELDKSCDFLKNLNILTNSDYIDKFTIYCLINNDQKEKAQMLFDLKKETGFEDNFFENKFDYLMGYSNKIEKNISEKNILDFHLSHRTNENFSYIPTDKTKEFIWKYLASYNLLEGIYEIDLDDEEKIKTIEKATHEKNYTENDLFNLYKRFQFNIDQLLNVKETYKLLPNYKSRAILYQRIILTYDTKEKIDLAFKLKNLMIKDNISNAFQNELVEILKTLDSNQIPPNYTSFYNENLVIEDENKKKIKFNNKIIHQSKLLNYFIKNYDLDRVSKDTNQILKKIKSDKSYVFSNKDKMLLDSIRFDGVEIKKNYLNLYEQNPNIPTDLQVLINDQDIGMILLRLVEIIGEDNYKDLGTETLYFITYVLNKINLDKIRNEVLLKILPLKV